MGRVSKIMLPGVFCALILVLIPQALFACQVDDFYLTRGGSLAASSPETLNEAITYEKEGNMNKLADLTGSGKLIKLANNSKIQVVERSVEWKMLKIKFSDKKDLYWIKDGSLKPIHCN